MIPIIVKHTTFLEKYLKENLSIDEKLITFGSKPNISLKNINELNNFTFKEINLMLEYCKKTNLHGIFLYDTILFINGAKRITLDRK